MSFGTNVTVGGLVVFEVLLAKTPAGRHVGVIGYRYDGKLIEFRVISTLAGY